MKKESFIYLFFPFHVVICYSAGVITPGLHLCLGCHEQLITKREAYVLYELLFIFSCIAT